MSASHTWIDKMNILRIQLRILFMYLVKLLLHLQLLLRFVQIVFPFGFQQIIWMPLHPQTPETILHHIAHNPVRRKKLCHRRNLFFRNLTVLGKSFILRLRIVILIQPADNLHLSAFFNIKIILRNIMNQMIDNALLINHRNIQQKLRIICRLFKKRWKYLI